MSRTIKIPDNMSPWEATINNAHYGPWPAGSTQTVPDEIAELILKNRELDPVEDPPETIEETITRIATPLIKTAVSSATDPTKVDFGTTDLTSLTDVTSKLSTSKFGEIKETRTYVRTIFSWTDANGSKVTSNAYEVTTDGDIYVIALKTSSNVPIGITYLRIIKDSSTIKAVTADVPFDAE